MRILWKVNSRINHNESQKREKNLRKACAKEEDGEEWQQRQKFSIGEVRVRWAMRK